MKIRSLCFYFVFLGEMGWEMNRDAGLGNELLGSFQSKYLFDFHSVILRIIQVLHF